MAEKIRVGHVGAGWMGTELLEKLVLHPDVEVVGLIETYEPRCKEALACESISTSNTRSPRKASPAERLTAGVVLPEPPFRFTIAILLAGITIYVTPRREHLSRLQASLPKM